MSDNDSYAEQIVAAYPRLLVEKYCIVASVALLYFDFVLTFPTEVRRIWEHKISGARLVFIVTRYTAIIERALFITEVFLWNSSDQTCGIISHAYDVLSTLNYLAFSAFTILGVYGVWGPRSPLLLIVVPLTLVKPAVSIWENTHYFAVQGGPPFGCFYSYTVSLATLLTVSQVGKIMTIAPNAILIIVTWVKTFGIYKVLSNVGMRTSLATLLLCDGTVYFIILLLSRLVIILSSNLPPPGFQPLVINVWSYFDNVLGPIFLSRFLLDICSLSFTDPKSHMGISITSANSFEISDTHFNVSRILGNLNAMGHEASNMQSRSAHPFDVDVEEMEGNELPEITGSTLSERAV